LRTDWHYPAFIRLSRCIFAVLLVCLGGCKPDEGYNGYEASSHQNTKASVSGSANPIVLAAAEHLYRGDIESAKTILSASENGIGTEQLKLLLNRHEQIEQYRLQERKKAYNEQLEELAKIEAKTTGQEPVDVNAVDEAMVAVLRLREYADEDKKEAIFELPFVRRIIDTMHQRGQAYEQEGKWLDAYAHSYYWLANLYENNKEYKDITERLTDLASIELSLKDSGCGETAVQRHEGIRPEMLLRALSALETNYVNSIDYIPMAEKALHRCELLGEVLLKSPEPLVWKSDAQAVESWSAGLQAIRSELQSADAATMRVEHLVRIFDEILALNTVTLKVPQEVIIAHFSEAALASLDPFTSLVWPWYVKDFEKSMTQQFTGIGVEISKSTGVLKILSLLPDTPAYKSGLDADDEIVAVNGEATDKMTIFCAVSKITGPKGTKVTLTIRRPITGQTWDVTLERAKIVVQPLRGWQRNEAGNWDYMIDPANGIGYIRLTAFTETSGPDLDDTLTALENKGLSAVILDLRFNSGGYLSSAAEVVDLFVSEGVIVKSSPRHGFATYEIAHRSGTHPNYPLVILINGASASASEIVAGALQDQRHQRTILVGERSYGKGSVQVVTPVTGGGSQLKYTVAYYHLPSDQQVKNRYQMERLGRKDWGIAPDVEVKMFSNELRSMIDLQRDNDVLFRADHGQNGEATLRHSLEKTLQSDPQLAVALMIAQTKLLAAGQTLTLAPLPTPQEAVVQEDIK
jgi:carboxyl-terminal processing protease